LTRQIPKLLKSASESGFNTLAFGKIKPYSGSLKDGRLDLVYYPDPGLKAGDQFRFGLCTDGLLRTGQQTFGSEAAAGGVPAMTCQ
jgi:hypothetical protein